MVGGTVVETIDTGDRIWVNCDEARVYQAGNGETVIIPSRVCAIFLERSNAARSISEGDSIWWQGKHAFWTPKSGGFSDFKLNRIGCSGVSRPVSSFTVTIHANV